MCIEEITAINARCSHEQGFLRPFICVASEEFFYAKGSNTQAQGLIKEWLCAGLAKEFGLPIPDYKLLKLDDDLKSLADPSWIDHLQFEYLFGSKSVAPCEKITTSDISLYDAFLQRDILVFDSWILNNDRMLTEAGGNPNLLVTFPSKDLMVIDHNLAFDDEFSKEDLRTYHVFANVLKRHPIQLPEQALYSERFEATLGKFDALVKDLPYEWLDAIDDPEEFLLSLRHILEQYTEDNYWGWLS